MTEKGETWAPRYITCARLAVRLRDMVRADGVVLNLMVADALDAEGLGKSSVRSYVTELVALGYIDHGVLSRKAVMDQTITIHVTPAGIAGTIERTVLGALIGYEELVEVSSDV